MNSTKIEQAELLLPCLNLNTNIAFFKEQLGFKIVVIFPADDPAVCLMTGHGLQLRLKRSKQLPTSPSRLSLLYKDNDVPPVMKAPNGTLIEFVPAHPPLNIPILEPTFVLSKMGGNSSWVLGRAGMRYRDLIPTRLGGRFIASHIHIPNAGPVPDYVHYHKVRFQMIYCYKGWARLVYQDQGEAFLFKAGDCILQPPEIRHRVLESSADLEVIEIGCPAEHETYQDHEMALPNQLALGLEYGDQFYNGHVANEAQWINWRVEGFECRDTGIGQATKGLASAKILRPLLSKQSPNMQHHAEFVFFFVLTGTLHLEHDAQTDALAAGDSFVLPAGMPHRFSNYSTDLELLEVSLPYQFKTTLNYQ